MTSSIRYTTRAGFDRRGRPTTIKRCRSRDYNYRFVTSTGYFERWGRRKRDDPDMAPPGPEILDIEIVTGSCTGGCAFCYKGNTEAPGACMSLETFAALLPRFLPQLTQVALGITDVDANPDLVPIMRHCREHGVVPNLTMTGLGMDEDLLASIAELAGAVAVSVHEGHEERAYDTVERLRRGGVEQRNLHLVYHDDNEAFLHRVLDAVQADPRLEGLHAVTLLALKPKGRAMRGFSTIDGEAFDRLVARGLGELGVLGFDSCSTPAFLDWIERSDLKPEQRERIMTMVEPCESGLFSLYVDAHGKAYPCSFAEGEPGWEEGIDLVALPPKEDALWQHARLGPWRERLLGGCRRCPLFELAG